MIYTVTLNPALDWTIYVERLLERESIRVIRQERYPGGKGIDVSRVIKSLGGESIATGFLGGFVGAEMEGRLINEGVACNFIKINEETRTNIIVHCTESGDELRFNLPGPRVSPAELATLMEFCRNLRPKPTFAIISGSAPEGVNPVVYQELVSIFETQGAKVILDTYGEPLRKGLLSTPFMIKPNRLELSQLVGRSLSDIGAVAEAAKELLQWTELVAVSLGAEGLLGATSEGVWLAKPPKVDAISTVGAGDSAVAAMVLALQEKMSTEEVIRRGAAAGTASTLTPGTATLRKKDFEKVLSETTVEKVRT